MLPKETLHLVNGEQLCDSQYARYRESQGFDRGKQEGIKEVVDDLQQAINTAKIGYTVATIEKCLMGWQDKLKKWGIKK